MSIWYKLVGKTPVPTNIDEMVETVDNKVAGDTVQVFEESVLISTVFLQLDHAHGSGPPVLFETMIFGGHFDQYQYRYHTWEQAEIGHKYCMELAQGIIDENELDTLMNEIKSQQS